MKGWTVMMKTMMKSRRKPDSVISDPGVGRFTGALEQCNGESVSFSKTTLFYFSQNNGVGRCTRVMQWWEC